MAEKHSVYITTTLPYVNADPHVGFAMEIIRANPGISQTDLAREIGMDKSVVVSLIDDFERRGWTVRERSQSDRRRHQLSVTPAGLAVLDTLVDNMLHVERVGLAALTAEEREVLIRALDKVYRAHVRPLA